MDMLRRPLADYLIHRFGAGTAVVNAVRFPRGSSRETWFIEYRATPDTLPRKVVFRSDYPSGSTIPSSLAQEYFMYERLGHTQVPVARALWWEEDPVWASRPFYVREHVDGSWEVPNFRDPDPCHDDLRIAVCKEHLRKLALVHQVDWRALGFDRWLPVPPSEAECGRTYIEAVEQQMRELRGEPIPLFVIGAHWLKSRAPAASRLCLCKGTNGIGEEVFKDRKIVAMSDWEEAVIGDPAADFASSQDIFPVIERDGEIIWGLEQALQYYHEVSDIRVKMESVRFYGMLRALKMIMFSQSAALGTHRTSQAHIRQAWTGTEVAHLGKRIMAAAMGLGPPVPGSRILELNRTME